MNSITIHPTRSTLETADIEKAMQQGRRLRAEAFTSVLKALFTRSKDTRTEEQGRFSPDCTAAA